MYKQDFNKLNKYLLNISLQNAIDDILSYKLIATERNRLLRNLFIQKFGIARPQANKLIKQVIWLYHRMARD